MIVRVRAMFRKVVIEVERDILQYMREFCKEALGECDGCPMLKICMEKPSAWQDKSLQDVKNAFEADLRPVPEKTYVGIIYYPTTKTLLEGIEYYKRQGKKVEILEVLEKGWEVRVT